MNTQEVFLSVISFQFLVRIVFFFSLLALAAVLIRLLGFSLPPPRNFEERICRLFLVYPASIDRDRLFAYTFAWFLAILIIAAISLISVMTFLSYPDDGFAIPGLEFVHIMVSVMNFIFLAMIAAVWILVIRPLDLEYPRKFKEFFLTLLGYPPASANRRRLLAIGIAGAVLMFASYVVARVGFYK